MAFYRKPSPLELTYLAQDTATASPMVNQYVVEGSGTLSLDTLHKAVLEVAAVLVEVRMRLKGHWVSRRWDDQGTMPTVRELDGQGWDGLSGHNAPFLGTPMNARTGPVCEVILLQGHPLRIVFRTHHACMDGAGTLFFMRQVFRALRGEPLERANSRLTEWDVALQNEPVERQVPLGNCEPVYRNADQAYAPGCQWRRFEFPGTPSGLNGKVMAIVSDWARDSGVARAVVRVPSDLRRYLGDGEFTASNCSAALDIDISDEHSPKKLQQKVIAAMRAKQDIACLIRKAALLHWLPLAMLRANDALKRKIHAANRYNYTCTVTHLGRLEPRHFSTQGFRCAALFGVPIALELTPLSIAFIHYENVTAMHVSMPNALGNDADLKRLCARLYQALDTIEGNTVKAVQPQTRVFPGMPVSIAS